MNTYRFRFNNSKKTLTILFWFFAALLTISLTIIVIVIPSDPLFPAWLLLISLPLMLTAIYRFFKAASERQSTEVVSLNEDGFTSSCFGSALYSDMRSIQIPAREIALLGGKQYDYYKQTDADFPNLVFSITIGESKTLIWILNEWGGLYNSKDDFTIFFDFLTALTDQLYQLYHVNESYNSYLKILDENGSWEKRS
ncbi:hypothetical protein TH53_02200 [Pedobacter lusitanus]|uniref:Uncharacterized protein n=1 Tax=Pedobacter lusitanus TaxID=1503925 RepID=A0A0D0FA91_9SPHI|nr:hypothetical protein [Pedobacter lusitanus]KIO78713.1 hypothetical protein TH53_02200 [Pedobacter lusitanus]